MLLALISRMMLLPRRSPPGAAGFSFAMTWMSDVPFAQLLRNA
jgi:hypothetical protein